MIALFHYEFLLFILTGPFINHTLREKVHRKTQNAEGSALSGVRCPLGVLGTVPWVKGDDCI